jgi:uncharacterized membrane protein YeaQ/YmgE (transglycosylase-associated protein family)
MYWILLIIVGAIVGALGRLVHPGRDPMGFIVTTIIGIASLLIAGAIFHHHHHIWAFVVGVIIAAILVAIIGRFWSTRSTRAAY